MVEHASEVQNVDEEKMRLREEWKSIFYDSAEATARRRHPQYYTFSENDLDNDDVISMVETIPTFRRTKEELNKIKNKAMNATDAASTEQGIHFSL